jgi:hypothetical protein
LPTLIGKPASMAITFESVVCSRRAGRVGISLITMLTRELLIRRCRE